MSKQFDPVSHRSTAMSYRQLGSIERSCGVAAAVSAAQGRGVHFVKLTDGKGNVLISASRHPFAALLRPRCGR